MIDKTRIQMNPVRDVPMIASLLKISDKSIDRSILLNSFFLIANSLVGSGFGFLFWMISARRYTPTDVGIGAAYVNAITMIALLGDMGLGIAVIRFIANLGGKQRAFINSTSLAVGISSLLIGMVFLIGVPFWSPDLIGITQNVGLFFFVLSMLSFSLAQFIDKLYIAFQKAYYLFSRNFIAGFLRILFLLLLNQQLGSNNILLAVGLSASITLLLSWLIFIPRTVPNFHPSLEFSITLLYEKAAYTILNQISQLMWSLPPLIFPLVVVRLLGPEANARFYISWMIANLLFIIPTSIATSTFAKVSNRSDQDASLFKRSLLFTLFGLTPVIPFMILFGSRFLSFFGEDYVAGSGLLAWLVISLYPYTVNTFTVTYYRIRTNKKNLLIASSLPFVLSLSMMAVGGIVGHLSGLGFGWFLAQSITGLLIYIWFTKNKRGMNGFRA